MKALLLLFAVCIACASCRYREVKEPMPFVNELKIGEKFRITLPENHINKESWNMLDDFDHNILHRLGDVWHGNEKGIDINLQCLSPGTTQLTFVKRRYSDTLELRKYIVQGKKQAK
jgi:hypothetical protein